jgi:FOG: Glucan-binding domain (YG repeat)
MKRISRGKIITAILCVLILSAVGILKLNAFQIDPSQTATMYIDNNGIVVKCADKSKIGKSVRLPNTNYLYVDYAWGYGFENEFLPHDYDRSNIVSQFWYHDSETGKDKYVVSKYFNCDGSLRTGWYNDGPKNISDPNYLIYINEKGYRVTGWQKIDGISYHFKNGSGFLDTCTTVDGYRVAWNGMSDKP